MADNGNGNGGAKIVKVTYTGPRIKVKSPKTGNVIDLDSNAVRKADFGLYRALTRDIPVHVEGDVELTTDQLNKLCDLAGIKRQAKETPKPAESDAVAEQTIVRTAQETADRTNGRLGASVIESRIHRAEAVVSECSEEMSMLIYDIPARLNDECPNPSGLLWHYGFRLNKSCWVLPKKGLEHPAVQELLAHWSLFKSVEVHIIPYAEKAMGRIKAIAREKLRKEVIRAHEALINRIGDAAERLNEAEKELDKRKSEGKETTALQYENVQTIHERCVRSALYGARQALAASIDCARLFDETENTIDLINGLRKAIEAQNEAFKASQKKQVHG